MTSPRPSPAARRVVAATTLLLLLGPPVVHADASAASVRFELLGPGWAAWRFNLTGETDLIVHSTFYGCDPDSVWGKFMFVVIDDESRIAMRRHEAGPWPWAEDIEVGVNGEAIALRPDLAPAGLPDGRCTGEYGWSFHAPPTSRSFTVLILHSSPLAWYNLTATWTRGVASTDTATGPGLSRTLSEFERGVSASAWGGVPTATVGVGLRQTATTSNITLGWFSPNGGMPPEEPTGVTIYSCRQNGADCPNPPRPYGDRTLTAVGPTAWDFEVTVKAQALEQPISVVGLFDIPCHYARNFGCE